MGMWRRGTALGLVVIVLGTGAACSSGTGSGAGAGATSTAAATSQPPGAGTSTRPRPVAALPPARDRWTYLAARPTVAVPVPDPSAERARLVKERTDAARPRPPGTDDRFTRVGEGTPTRFADLMVDIGRRRTVNPLRVARLGALVAVAGHEAALAAARTSLPAGRTPQQVDPVLGRAVPGVDSAGVELPAGQLPPEFVTATAQRTVGCSLSPVECPRIERLAEIARRRLVLSGAVWPSTIDAARQLGEQVGLSVLALGATDRAAPWKAAPDDLPPGGEWVPTPGSFSPALEPFAGTWRPWNLRSGDEFRPGPPPAAGTPAHAAAVQQVLDEATNLSDRALRRVAFWDLGPGTSTPPGYWLSDIAADAFREAPVADQASALALVATAELDAGVAAWDTKFAYRSVRPVTAIRKGPAPQWLPSLQTPAFPAYVSGHSVFSAAAAQVLAVLEPSRADEFLDAAAEASDSRLTGGIHYWFDLTEGAELGRKVGDAALGRAGLRPPTGVRSVRERLRFTSADVRTGPVR